MTQRLRRIFYGNLIPLGKQVDLRLYHEHLAWVKHKPFDVACFDQGNTLSKTSWYLSLKRCNAVVVPYTPWSKASPTSSRGIVRTTFSGKTCLDRRSLSLRGNASSRRRFFVVLKRLLL